MKQILQNLKLDIAWSSLMLAVSAPVSLIIALWVEYWFPRKTPPALAAKSYPKNFSNSKQKLKHFWLELPPEKS